MSLPGCIRNVTVNNVDIGPPTADFKTQECYRDSPSSGVSFEDGGGFLKVGKSVAQKGVLWPVKVGLKYHKL